jgi:hypothetical protein
MKASILLIFAFLISGHANQARATIVPSQKLPAEHFRLEFTDLNHDTRWYPGILLYVRTDRYVKVFDIPDWGQAKHLIFSKRLPRAAKSTIDFLNLKLDSLDNAYSNPCILPTCGEEFKVTFRRSKYYKSITLHNYYLKQVGHIVKLFNDGIPEQFRIIYQPKVTWQECTPDTTGLSERMRMRKLFDSTFITLSAIRFDHYVDSCIALLETKRLSEISDSGHIYIILCANTIFYTFIANGFQQRFVGGRYEKFNEIIFNTSYTKNIGSFYPDWKSTGSGLYFPRLQVEYGGLLHRHSLFKVQDPIIDGQARAGGQ